MFGMGFLLASAFSTFLSSSRAAPAHSRAIELPCTSGPVTAMALEGDTLYLGGAFGAIGPASGGGVPVDDKGGVPWRRYPRVTGEVQSVAGDGFGGWFIGGRFIAVGGVPRHGLAHVLADGSLGRWDPDPDSSTITSVVVAGGTVYVAGRFKHVGGASRSSLAALDVISGRARAWDPKPDGYVETLLVGGSTVWVAGTFAHVGGAARNRLAALDARTGVATSWRPDPDRKVFTMALVASTLYVGGDFHSIEGEARSGLAAIDLATGRVTAWAPELSAVLAGAPEVTVLAADERAVYVAGGYQHAGGQPREGLAAIDRRSALATNWNPFPVESGNAYRHPIRAMALQHHQLFISGDFSLTERLVEALDLDSGAVTAWAPRPGGRVDALAASGPSVYIGGEFNLIHDWQPRSGLAAVDLRSGEILPWHPDGRGVDDHRSMTATGGQVFVGGFFRSLRIANIASFDIRTGAQTHTDSRTDAGVLALLGEGTTVFAGGNFDSVGGSYRPNLGAFDARTGRATAWDSKIDPLGGGVDALALRGSVLYGGGAITKVAGIPRRGLAAWDAITGALLPWDPSADGLVSAVAATSTSVFVAGSFASVGGSPRPGLAALDPLNGVATSWNPGAVFGTDPTSPPVRSMAASNGVIYVAGAITSIGGAERRGVAALDAATAGILEWDAPLDGTVRALEIRGDRVILGGDFARVGLEPTPFLAMLPAARAPVRLRAVEIADFSGRKGISMEFTRVTPVTATIRFSLPGPGSVTVGMYDVQGRNVATALAGAVLTGGEHTLAIRTDRLPSGVYFCRLVADNVSAVRRIAIIR